MANLQATIRGLTLTGLPPGDALGRANRLLFRSTDVGKFVTLFFAVLDPARHELRFSNAGHERPLLFPAEGPHRQLESAGFMLSFLEKTVYEEDSVLLGAGEVLVVYSDGITDAVNGEAAEYGETRLVDLVGEHRREPAPALLDRIFRDVRAHAGAEPQMDDMTVVVVKRKQTTDQ
jgi:sigma-B regulation protein RsbU (phosphoserine phosphatase)